MQYKVTVQGSSWTLIHSDDDTCVLQDDQTKSTIVMHSRVLLSLVRSAGLIR